jgi:hypothetical protein
MRKLRSSLTVFAAALYVLLGISASWHAPHFMRGAVSIGVDRHGEHESALDGDSCALCSTKKSAQESSPSSVAVFAARAVGTVPARGSAAPVEEFFGASRARAPPALS